MIYPDWRPKSFPFNHFLDFIIEIICLNSISKRLQIRCFDHVPSDQAVAGDSRRGHHSAGSYVISTFVAVHKFSNGGRLPKATAGAPAGAACGTPAHVTPLAITSNTSF
jgi:hypothetical protein